MKPRTLTLAAIELALGVLEAVAVGLVTIRQHIEREQRREAKAKRFREQAGREIEAMTR